MHAQEAVGCMRTHLPVVDSFLLYCGACFKAASQRSRV
jgi:hypothetical protein